MHLIVRLQGIERKKKERILIGSRVLLGTGIGMVGNLMVTVSVVAGDTMKVGG